MANEGIIFGGDILLYENSGTEETPVWTAFAHATTHSRSGSTTMRTRAHKDDGGASGVKPGRHEPGTISISGLKSYDGNDFDALEAKRLARTRIPVKYSGRPALDPDIVETAEATGDTYYTVYAFISKCDTEDPVDGDSTYTAELTMDGVPTPSTVV